MRSSPVALKISNGPYAGKTINTSGTVDFNEQYAIDAVTSTRFLTGTSKRLYESTNQGDTLKDLGVALPTAPDLHRLWREVRRRLQPGPALCGRQQDLFPPEGGGDAHHPRQLSRRAMRQFVAADPNNYKNVYAVNFFNQVFASNDAGVSWTEVTGNLGTLGNQIQTLTVYSTPDDSKIELLAGGLSLTGTQGGVFGLLNPGPTARPGPTSAAACPTPSSINCSTTRRTTC